MDVPVNSIIIWFNSIMLIPSGWQLCDGTNGTPDLRGKFVMGISADDDLGDSFGSESHVHSNSATQPDGDHIHDITGSLGGTPDHVDVTYSPSGTNSGLDPTHQHVVDLDAPPSGGHSHTTSDTNSAANLPPYVQVHYIMRLV